LESGADHSEERWVAEDYKFRFFSWSPSSRRIAVLRFPKAQTYPAKIFIAPIADGSVVTLDYQFGFTNVPKWSPDEKYIAFTKSPPFQWDPVELVVYALNTGRTTVLKSSDLIVALGWTPKGHQILCRVSEKAPWEQELILLSLSGQRVSDLGVFTDGFIDWAGFSPDGSRMAFFEGSHLHLVNLSRGNRKRWEGFTGVRWPCWWSEDGGSLVYYIRKGSGRVVEAIERLHLATGEKERLFSGGELLKTGQVDWSPVQQRLVFADGGEGGMSQDLWSIAPGDQAAVRLTQDGGNEQPQWSPDGRWIAFIHNETELCIIDWRSGKRRTILQCEGPEVPKGGTEDRSAKPEDRR